MHFLCNITQGFLNKKNDLAFFTMAIGQFMKKISTSYWFYKSWQKEYFTNTLDFKQKLENEIQF